MNINELPKDYWQVIENYLPKYDSRDDVLENDILSRYTTDQEVCKSDLQWIKESFEDPQKVLNELNIQLYMEAFEAMKKVVPLMYKGYLIEKKEYYLELSNLGNKNDFDIKFYNWNILKNFIDNLK